MAKKDPTPAAADERALAPVAPSWLANVEPDDSLESLSRYRTLPRAHILQGLSAPNLKDAHGEGAVLLVPGEACIARAETPFLIVPVFQFTEYVTWNDRRDKNNPPVVERSLDHDSEVARRSRNAAMREEEYAGGPQNKPFIRRHVEHLIFASVIYGQHPLSGTLFALNFSRGEARQGMNFASACAMRRYESKRVPLWAQVWELCSTRRVKDDRNWFGLDFTVPEQPFVAEEHAQQMREIFEQCKADHAARILTVDVSTEAERGAPEAPSGSAVADM